MEELKLQHEREIQVIQAEHVKDTSKLKAKIHEIIQAAQVIIFRSFKFDIFVLIYICICRCSSTCYTLCNSNFLRFSKVSENKIRNDVENIIGNERDKQSLNFAMEIEKMEEKHRTEVKKIQVCPSSFQYQCHVINHFLMSFMVVFYCYCLLHLRSGSA